MYSTKEEGALRTACPAGRVVKALQGHRGSVDGVGAGLDVGAGGDVLGRLVVITTTTTVLIRDIRHWVGVPRLRAGAERFGGGGLNWTVKT